MRKKLFKIWEKSMMILIKTMLWFVYVIFLTLYNLFLVLSFPVIVYKVIKKIVNNAREETRKHYEKQTIHDERE